MSSRSTAFRHATILLVYLFVFWGSYRFIFQFPVPWEEFVIKPIVWVIPVLLFLKLEKQKISSLGISLKNLFSSVYLSLGLGIMFASVGILVNFLKYGQKLQFLANIGGEVFLLSFMITLATAVSEEIAFRGFIFTRLHKAFNSEWSANLASSLGWTVLHFPAAFVSISSDFWGTVIYLFLVFIFGVGASFVFARTKNIAAPILLHVLWEWPIILFR